ncbi:hypothetical protein A6A08_18300 [Nocardiopsis sp. TSRI0078]|nr:hypothetical protein A6A08_18300 [Nocardiopsis sp. TSRI0078]
MQRVFAGRFTLLPAPVLALAATLILIALGPQIDVVLVWGTLATLVSAIPIAVPSRYLGVAIWSCAALLTVGVVISILSIGVFYAPALIALVLSGIFTPALYDD